MKATFQYTKSSVEQFANFHAQTERQLIDHGNGGIPRAAFEVADIGAVDIGFERELLLRPALGLAQAAQIQGKALTNIHASQGGEV